MMEVIDLNFRELSLESKCTYDFLKQLSLHMSSRKNCKNVEYVVCINDGDIQVDPCIFCYNDRYHRSDRDRLRVDEHILKYHIQNSVLVDGVYKYAFSVSKKSRHWIKIK